MLVWWHSHYISTWIFSFSSTAHAFYRGTIVEQIFRGFLSLEGEPRFVRLERDPDVRARIFFREAAIRFECFLGFACWIVATE